MYVKKILLAVLLTALSTIAVSAQCSDAQTKALEKWDRDWAKHSDDGNRAELDKIYADDFAGIGFLAITDKKQAIDNTISGNAAPNQPVSTYDNYMISCTPNTATITHRNVTKSMADGKESVSYSRAIHFLEKRGKNWQVVSSTGHPMSDESALIFNKEMDGYQAYMRRDIGWFEQNTADNYMGIGLDGNMANKSQMIERMKNDKNKYESVRLSNVSIRNEGDMAVITGVYNIKAMDPAGKPMEMKMRFTRTLTKKDGDWKAIASQVTLMNDGPIASTN